VRAALILILPRIGTRIADGSPTADGPSATGLRISMPTAINVNTPLELLAL
jgi:hypothetical protein